MEEVNHTCDLMTDAEVADLFRINVATLRRWLRQGGKGVCEIKRINVGQRRWVRASVMEFINGK